MSLSLFEADLNHDGRLSFDEFTAWYSGQEGQDMQAISDSTPEWVNLPEVRRLTALENHNVEDDPRCVTSNVNFKEV